MAEVGEVTALGREQFDIRIKGAEESVAITVLEGWCLASE